MPPAREKHPKNGMEDPSEEESSPSPAITPKSGRLDHQYHESLSTLNEASGEEANVTNNGSSTQGSKSTSTAVQRF
jgi:hypothetical protein